MVEIYFDCRNQKVYPYPGSVVQQTPFTRDLFEHLDSIVDEHVERRKAEIERERKKAAQRKK